MGRPETASSRLNLTQAFNSLGTTLAPYFGGLFILAMPVKTSDELKSLSAEALAVYQSAQAKLVQLPYLGLAFTLFIIVVIFLLIRLPNVNASATEERDGKSTADDKNAWHYQHLVLGTLAIFFYVGAEVSIGSFLISYLGQPHIAGLSAQAASAYVSYYWGGAMVGRFLGASLMQYLAASRLLTFNALTAVILVLIAVSMSGHIAMWSLLAIGFHTSL